MGVVSKHRHESEVIDQLTVEARARRRDESGLHRRRGIRDVDYPQCARSDQVSDIVSQLDVVSIEVLDDVDGSH